MLSGPITQVCWVVPEIATTEKALSALMGVKRWTRMDGIEFPAEDTTYRGEPTALTAHVSLSYVGDLQLERSMADGAVRFAYLDGSAFGTPYVELAQIAPSMRAFYDRIKQESQ